MSRPGWPLVAACLAGLAAAGRVEAAAVTSYAVRDLGTAYNNIQPGDSGYSAPRVSNTGAISYGSIGGIVSVGGYSETYATYGIGQTVIQYNAPGSAPVDLAFRGYGSDPAHQGDTATGLSDNGIALGFRKVSAGSPIDNESNSTAFVYRPGGPTSQGQMPGLSVVPGVVPGTAAWFALGVNSSGTIVGQAPASAAARLSLFGDFNSGHFSTGPNGRAFVSDGTTSTDLNTLIGPGLGYLLTAATSINDRGQITAFGFSADDPVTGIHAFLLTPNATPEPGAWALGLAVMGWARARRWAGRCGRR